MCLGAGLGAIGLVPIEPEIGRKPAAEGAQTLQEFVAPGLARNAKRLGIRDVDFNLVAFLEAKRFDHRGGKPHRETVSPFGNTHTGLHLIYVR